MAWLILFHPIMHRQNAQNYKFVSEGLQSGLHASMDLRASSDYKNRINSIPAGEIERCSRSPNDWHL